MNIITILPLIKKFKGRFFNGAITQYSWQYFLKGMDDVVYFPPKCWCNKGYGCNDHPKAELTEQHLIDHFSGTAMKMNSGSRGCLAVPALQNNRFKWFVVDSDNLEATTALNNKLVPVLKKYGIDYIYETGSTPVKCHIWFMVDCSRIILEQFTHQIFNEADILFNGRDRSLQLEVYPTNKPNSLIRIPGGIHLRNNQVNPISYKGKMSSEVEFILKTFTECKQHTEEELFKMLKIPSSEFTKITEKKPFKYQPVNLEVNYETPKALENVVKNCQAINHLLDKVINEREFEKRGWNIHTAGLYLAQIAAGIDKHNRDDQRTVFNWYLDVLEKYRTRSASSHKWVDKLKVSSKTVKVPFCKTWHRDLNLCDGCPFKDKENFYSPKQLYENPPSNLLPKKVTEVNLKTLDEIRNTTFKKIKERIYHYSHNNIQTDILLASPQGSGKSFLSDEIAADLVKKQNKNVLIAVPTAELALEHRKRLRNLGIEPFILMSHTNLFKKDDGKRRFNIEFDCPKEKEISDLISLGVDSSSYKKQFCGPCKFKASCPYPGQYSKAAEDDHKVIIIQHAHFSCRETLFNLISKKKFDVMIIDEEFIDSLIKMYKITDAELNILEKFVGEIEWVDRLIDWFRGGSKEYKVIPRTQNDLEKIRLSFLEHMMPWNLSEYILQYNYKNTYSPETGLCLFYPLPNISIRLFTDATPPVEMLSIICNNPNIEIFGKNEILNHLKLNPKNKIIQVLDNSSSKTSLDAFNERKFYRIMEGIGRLIKNVYKGTQALLITYSGKHADLAKAFFKVRYPEVLPHLTISYMSIGTNKYENYKVLFQVAGVHFNSKQLALNSYKLKCVKNYWHRLRGEPQIDNEYPKEIQEGSGVDIKDIPLQRVENGPDGPGLYRYSDFKVYRPKDPYYYLFYLLSLSKRQQAMRLRFNDKAEKHAYLFDAAPRETLLITDSILLTDIC